MGTRDPVFDGLEQPAASFRDFHYGAVEGFLIGPGGFLEAADLADKLQGRTVKLVGRGGESGAAENLNASTHAPSILNR
jgi:hypothetical protein